MALSLCVELALLNKRADGSRSHLEASIGSAARIVDLLPPQFGVPFVGAAASELRCEYRRAFPDLRRRTQQTTAVLSRLAELRWIDQQVIRDVPDHLDVDRALREVPTR